MVFRKELRKLKFTEYKESEQFYNQGWDYMFDYLTQELFSHCEVDGTFEYIAKIDDIEHLERVLELI